MNEATKEIVRNKATSLELAEAKSLTEIKEQIIMRNSFEDCFIPKLLRSGDRL